MAESNLNAEQSLCLEKVISGRNVFITGSAGTGKSYLVNHIVDHLKNNNINHGITAMSASASLLISGKTLHSFLGIGLASKSAEELAEGVKKKRYIIGKLRSLQVLIIDEISLMGDKLFEKVSAVLSLIKRKSVAFGGIQMIFVGDFLQNPPINENYAFESIAWEQADIEVIELKTLIRQNGDVKFARMLQKIRYGRCSEQTYQRLCKLQNNTFTGLVKPTILYAKNVDIDAINLQQLRSLTSELNPVRTYTMLKSHNNAECAKWMETLRCKNEVDLVRGAQVMVTWNIDQEEGLVNGTRGCVIDMNPEAVLIELVNGERANIEYIEISNPDDLEMSIKFMPLKLAFAISIFKSQGQTINCVAMDLGKSLFGFAQAYVALSRARDRKSIKLLDIELASIRADPKAVAFYKNISN